MPKIDAYPYNPSGSSPKSIGGIMSIFDQFRTVINALDQDNFASGAIPINVYGKLSIPTEESRTNTVYGLMDTEDELKDVVVGANGLLLVFFRAKVKSSVSAAGRVGLFLDSTQIRNVNNASAIEAATEGTTYRIMGSANSGIANFATDGTDVTTGQVFGGEVLPILVDPGTYDVSARFRATSGSVTTKNRHLMAVTLRE